MHVMTLSQTLNAHNQTVHVYPDIINHGILCTFTSAVHFQDTAQHFSSIAVGSSVQQTFIL